MDGMQDTSKKYEKLEYEPLTNDLLFHMVFTKELNRIEKSAQLFSEYSC